MRQIALPLDELRSGASSSLIITACNATAFAGLSNAAHWAKRCAILTGPARSGKSLMARYFSGQDGTVMDDAEACSDEVLFNAWNRAQESGHKRLARETDAAELAYMRQLRGSPHDLAPVVEVVRAATRR